MGFDTAIALIMQLSQSFRFEAAYIVRLLHEFERIHVVADPRCTIVQAAELAGTGL
jgi:hypothetical protein